MSPFFVTVLTFFILASCDLLRDEAAQIAPLEGKPIEKEGDEGTATAPTTAPAYDLTVLMRDRKLGSAKTWITAEAEPGDSLIITIEELFAEPDFREEVRPYDVFYRPAPFGCPEGCPDIPSYPDCFARARAAVEADHGDDPDHTMDGPYVGIEMDGNIYPLGETVARGRSTVTSEFFITEEMVAPDSDYTSAYFVVDFPLGYKERNGIGTLGFIDPDACPGAEERERIMSNVQYYGQLSIKYSATVVLRTRRGEEKNEKKRIGKDNPRRGGLRPSV